MRKRPSKGQVHTEKGSKEVVVVVPSKWKALRRVGAVRDSAEKEPICGLVRKWYSLDLLEYSGLNFQAAGGGAQLSTQCIYPKIKAIESMADESLRLTHFCSA